jgi:hypothetical protein
LALQVYESENDVPGLVELFTHTMKAQLSGKVSEIQNHLMSHSLPNEKQILFEVGNLATLEEVGNLIERVDNIMIEGLNLDKEKTVRTVEFLCCGPRTGTDDDAVAELQSHLLARISEPSLCIAMGPGTTVTILDPIDSVPVSTEQIASLDRAIAEIKGAGDAPTAGLVVERGTQKLQGCMQAGLAITDAMLEGIELKTAEVDNWEKTAKCEEARTKLRELADVYELLRAQFRSRGRLIIAPSPELRDYRLYVARTANLPWLGHLAEVADGFYSEMARESGITWMGVPECKDPEQLLLHLQGALDRAAKWPEQTGTVWASVQTARKPAIAPKRTCGPGPSITPLAAVIRAARRTRVELDLFGFPSEIDPVMVAGYTDELLGVASEQIGKRLPLDFLVALTNLGQASAAFPERARDIRDHFDQALQAALAPLQTVQSPDAATPSPPPGL